MAITLAQSGNELKSVLQYLDKGLLEGLLEWARQQYPAILEGIDDVLAERPQGMHIEHRRAVWYQTCLGAVKVNRRQYRDNEGKYRYLLDELMGMNKYSHMTASVKEPALELAAAMPYRRAVEVLRKTSAIDLAHQTLWRLMAKVTDPHLEEAEQGLRWFLETGEIPEGEGKQVARLLVEADGVMLSLQREKDRKAEVKVGIAYEGWEKVGKDRYRTVNKTVFADTGGEQAFWAGMTLKLQGKYDLSRVADTIVGGDGAGWVKAGASYIGGQFQLDRYHLNRELTAALGRDKETKRKVWQACQCGEVETGLSIINEAMNQTRGEQTNKMAHACNYLRENRSGIMDYRMRLGEEGKNMRRTGAMEGNVDKLVVRRMKNQGMSWTLKGIRRLLCVRFLVIEGKLSQWLESRNTPGTPIGIPKRKIRRIVTRLSSQEPDNWLQAGIPALHGPHAGRPWVKILKNLSEGAIL